MAQLVIISYAVVPQGEKPMIQVNTGKELKVFSPEEISAAVSILLAMI